MSEPSAAPPPLPPAAAEDDNPPSLLVVAVLLVLSLALLGSKADEITDGWRGPAALTAAQVGALRGGGLTGRWVEVQADEVAGTDVEQTTLHVLKVGPVPLPAGQEGARLALVRTGQAYLAAYLPAGVRPEALSGKKLQGIVKAWPASVSRPDEVSALVVDTTEDEPSWFVGLLVAGFAGLCVWQLWLGIRRRLRPAAR